MRTPASATVRPRSFRLRRLAPVAVAGAAIAVLAPLAADAQGSDPGLVFHPISPCVVYNSLGSATPPAKFDIGETRSVATVSADYSSQGGQASSCGLPADVEAVHLNLVAVNPEGRGVIQAWPGDQAAPVNGGVASLVQFQIDSPNPNIANAAPVEVAEDTDGTVKVQVFGAKVDVQVILLGYYTGDELTALDGRLDQVEADITALQAAPPVPVVLSARVNELGVVLGGSAGMTTTKIGVGRYRVDFGVDVSSCVYATSSSEYAVFIRVTPLGSLPFADSVCDAPRRTEEVDRGQPVGRRDHRHDDGHPGGSAGQAELREPHRYP